MPNIVEVNGIKYIQNESESSSPKMSRRMSSIITMATMFGGMADYGAKPFKAPTNDIVGEYALIQQKKSALSSNERKWVVAQFEGSFTKLDENT